MYTIIALRPEKKNTKMQNPKHAKDRSSLIRPLLRWNVNVQIHSSGNNSQDPGARMVYILWQLIKQSFKKDRFYIDLQG